MLCHNSTQTEKEHATSVDRSGTETFASKSNSLMSVACQMMNLSV